MADVPETESSVEERLANYFTPQKAAPKAPIAQPEAPVSEEAPVEEAPVAEEAQNQEEETQEQVSDEQPPEGDDLALRPLLDARSGSSSRRRWCARGSGRR